MKLIAAAAVALILIGCAQGQQGPASSLSTNADGVIDQLLPAPSYVADNRPGNVGPLCFKPTDRRRYRMAMAGVEFPFIGEGSMTQVADANGNVITSAFLDRMQVKVRGQLYPIDMRGILFQRGTFAPDGTLLESALIDYEDLSGDIKHVSSPYLTQEQWDNTLKSMFNRNRALVITMAKASGGTPLPNKPVPIGSTYTDRSGDAFYAYAGDVGLNAVFRSSASSANPQANPSWSSERAMNLPPAARTGMARELFAAMKMQNLAVRAQITGRAISSACDCVKLRIVATSDIVTTQGALASSNTTDAVFDSQLGFYRLVEERTISGSTTQLTRTIVE